MPDNAVKKPVSIKKVILRVDVLIGLVEGDLTKISASQPPPCGNSWGWCR